MRTCDHICGVSFFPDATVVAAASVWGLDLPDDLRVDREFAAGTTLTLTLGELITVDAAGHSQDGVAYVLTEERVMLAGDYLSASMYPLGWWSVAESANATQRLLAAIVRWDVQSVVPGHGPILSADDALAIGHADIGYFRELEQAAQSASMRGVSYADAVYGILEVEPPRPSDPDIEFLAPGLLNATRALSEVGIEPPPANPAPWDYLTGSSWSAANQEG